MEIIDSILSDSEVRDMSDECLIAFVKTLDPTMKDMIITYLSSDEGIPEVKAKIERCVGNDLRSSTFHLRVREHGVVAMLRNYNLRTLPSQVYGRMIDLNKYISELEWLSENEGLIASSVPARNKTDYEKALELIIEFQSNHGAVHHHNLPAIMKRYKDRLFCPPREKEQPTGLAFLSSGKSMWKMQKRAAEYLKYCADNGISEVNSREV